MKVATKEEIKAFLNEFRYLIQQRHMYVVNRYENDIALIELGITKKGQKQELKSLSVLDYSSGPFKDKDKPGYIWIFGKQIRNKEVYIKLKISELPTGNRAICLSFHPSNEPLQFPYKLESQNTAP